MEKFYTELEEILKKDVKNVLNRNTSDAKSRIDNLRIVKDDLYILDSIKDNVKEEKLELSNNNEKFESIDYFNIFETMYKDGLSCVFDTRNIDRRINRTSSKEYSLMKFAHKHGAYYLTPGMNTDDFRTKEIELFGSNNIRFIPVASEQSSQLKGLVCIDDEIFITGYNVDVLNKLKENSILYGFNSLNVEYKPKEI